MGQTDGRIAVSFIKIGARSGSVFESYAFRILTDGSGTCWPIMWCRWLKLLRSYKHASVDSDSGRSINRGVRGYDSSGKFDKIVSNGTRKRKKQISRTCFVGVLF